jgi:hypothetical protein
MEDEKQQQVLQGGEAETPRWTKQQASAEAPAGTAVPAVPEPGDQVLLLQLWTAGGALCNVLVGAGRHKNRPLGPIATVAAGNGHHHLHGFHYHHRVAAGYVLARVVRVLEQL